MHDLLAFLAEEMIRLNKQKRAAQREFLDWLVETLRILPDKDGRRGIDALTGKAKLADYPGDYQKGEPPLATADLLEILRKNKSRLGVSLSDAALLDRVGRVYEESLARVLPLKETAQEDGRADRRGGVPLVWADGGGDQGGGGKGIKRLWTVLSHIRYNFLTGGRATCQHLNGGAYAVERDGLLVILRSATVFRSVASFTSALNEFDMPVVASINAHLLHFERAWKASRHDGEIPTGFYFEAYADVDGPYRLCQIRVGPNHGFRALVMFLNNSPDAYWIYIFKKVKNRQPEDMKRARTLAQRL